MKCPLCQVETPTAFYNKDAHIFYLCVTCDGIFRSPIDHLNRTLEYQRYLTHNNEVDDPRYQAFVSPIVEHVTAHFNPAIHKGLDYGAGPGPVITKLLNEKHFQLALYDPFFWPETNVLDDTYDFIVCCEVMEHFYNPALEFKKLRQLLKKGGQLICKTALYDKSIDFDRWYYKNDPTHVFLYSAKTVDWIAGHFEFKKVTIQHGILAFYN